MAEYIERKLLKKRFLKRLDWLKKDIHDEYSRALYDCCETDTDLIDEIPAADVAPIRHGHWIRVSLIGVFECSECGGQIIVTDSKFAKEVCRWCCHCGAKMDEGVSE